MSSQKPKKNDNIRINSPAHPLCKYATPVPSPLGCTARHGRTWETRRLLFSHLYDQAQRQTAGTANHSPSPLHHFAKKCTAWSTRLNALLPHRLYVPNHRSCIIHKKLKPHVHNRSRDTRNKTNGTCRIQETNLGVDDRSGTLFCYKLTTRDSNILEIPQSVTNTFLLKGTAHCYLADCNGVRFQVLIVLQNNTATLGCGWHNFVHEAGTEPGDTLVFDFLGGGTANVTVFSADGWQRLPKSSGIPGNAGELIEVEARQRKIIRETIIQMRREGYKGWIEFGPGVVLEHWIEEYLAAEIGGVKPKSPYYLTRVLPGSLNGSAQYFPAEYTAIAIRPLLKSKKEIVFLRPTEGEGPRVSLKIAKDGRGMLTRGWREFATQNGVEPGALVAFSFHTLEGRASISLDVMNEGQKA
ncbi:hypothetical protein ACP70R_040246 [Stipagrostis hirtigluma subsp. patula]